MSGEPRPDGPAARPRLVRDARHQHDRDDGQADPGEDHGAGGCPRGRSRHDRDDRGEDAGDRRDDAHPADASPRYSAVMPNPPAIAGHDAPERGRRGSGTASPDDQREGQRDGHPDELRDEDDAEDRRASAQQPAAEVAAAPDDRGGEPEDDGRGPGRAGPRSGRPLRRGAPAVPARVLDAVVDAVGPAARRRRRPRSS